MGSFSRVVANAENETGVKTGVKSIEGLTPIAPLELLRLEELKADLISGRIQPRTDFEIKLRQSLFLDIKRKEINSNYLKASENLKELKTIRAKGFNKEGREDTNILRRRISIPIAIETIEGQSALNNYQMKVGKYKLRYEGDLAHKLNKYFNQLPIRLEANGKEFIVSNITNGKTNDGGDFINIHIDLVQNIIPLLIIGGVVGSALLGGTGYVLTKVEKVISAPIWFVAGGIILLFLFMRR